MFEENLVLGVHGICGYSCILGAFLGIIYDVFKMVRLIFKNRILSVFIQDIIYFFVSSIFTFLFLLAVNQGQVRFYIIAFIFVGWFFYYVVFSRVIFKFLNKLLNFRTRRVKISRTNATSSEVDSSS
ncbi:MAG: spore cortex biosynthesis protein YabQ [Oscillospiraceae bacterium]|jgi:spore cortex biosynthesis protein YabQ|nr:spore cortex biosynthesis protein YabQ [Oscillospiraceae bacterium]